jgi:hypothetical protein
MEVLWFNNGLRIGEGSTPNTDSYIDAYGDMVTFYKQIQVLAGANGIVIFDAQNSVRLYTEGAALKCSINGIVRTIATA